MQRRATTKMPRRLRKTSMIAGMTVAVVAGALLLSFREQLLLAIGDYLVIQDNLHPADVIAVISGPDDRTDHAIELYKRGLGARLFFTGGWCDTIQGVHALRGQEHAIAQGVPRSDIAIDSAHVISTYEEAVRLKAYIDKSPGLVKSVIIVSDPYHMRRARWAYRARAGKGHQRTGRTRPVRAVTVPAPVVAR